VLFTCVFLCDCATVVIAAHVIEQYCVAPLHALQVDVNSGEGNRTIGRGGASIANQYLQCIECRLLSTIVVLRSIVLSLLCDRSEHLVVPEHWSP
jgi:hypothetical protein